MKKNLAYGLRGKVLMPCAYRLMGDRRFQYIDGLMARDSWSRSEIEDHQARRLTWLFQLCVEHNPYWRAKFDQHGLKPGGSNPFTELKKLPVLTKDELRKNWRDMRSHHLPERDLILGTSSGSTGMPITVYHSQSYRALHAAMAYRMRSWMGLRVGEPVITVRANTGHMSKMKIFKRAVRKRIEGETLIDAFQISPVNTPPLLRSAARTGPAAVYGYVTALTTVAKMCREHGISWPSVRVVATTSEPLREQDRKLLREVFDAEVYDRYGCNEVLSIAMECRAHRHRHIFADCNLVEFHALKGDSKGMYEVVVTPLDNDAMPMFRYRGGDTASSIEGTCPCGSALPLMAAVDGRVCNNFVTPNGRLIHGMYFAHFFNFTDRFRSFQFHQTSPGHIDLYVIPEGEVTEEHDALLSDCRSRINRDYEDQFYVEFHYVDHIDPTPAGKHLFTISDVLKQQESLAPAL